MCGSLDRDYQSFHCPIPSIKPFKAKLKATLIQAPVSKEDNVFTLSTKVFWGQSEVACQNCYSHFVKKPKVSVSGAHLWD